MGRQIEQRKENRRCLGRVTAAVQVAVISVVCSYLGSTRIRIVLFHQACSFRDNAQEKGILDKLAKSILESNRVSDVTASSPSYPVQLHP